MKGATEKEIYAIFDLFDADKDDTIEFDEFVLVMAIHIAHRDNVTMNFMLYNLQICFDLLDEKSAGNIFESSYKHFVKTNPKKKYEFPFNLTYEQIVEIIISWKKFLNKDKSNAHLIKYYDSFYNILEGKPLDKSIKLEFANLDKDAKPTTKEDLNRMLNAGAIATSMTNEKNKDIEKEVIEKGDYKVKVVIGGKREDNKFYNMFEKNDENYKKIKKEIYNDVKIAIGYLEIYYHTEEKYNLDSYSFKIGEYGAFLIGDFDRNSQLDILFPHLNEPKVTIFYNQFQSNHNWDENYCEIIKNNNDVKEKKYKKVFNEFFLNDSKTYKTIDLIKNNSQNYTFYGSETLIRAGDFGSTGIPGLLAIFKTNETNNKNKIIKLFEFEKDKITEVDLKLDTYLEKMDIQYDDFMMLLEQNGNSSNEDISIIIKEVKTAAGLNEDQSNI